jgi:hypothetical protein
MRYAPHRFHRRTQTYDFWQATVFTLAMYRIIDGEQYRWAVLFRHGNADVPLEMYRTAYRKIISGIRYRYTIRGRIHHQLSRLRRFAINNWRKIFPLPPEPDTEE